MLSNRRKHSCTQEARQVGKYMLSVTILDFYFLILEY